jgi:prefoldin subunit 5
LAKKQDRLEERAETISAQRLRIQELEAEVERLRKALEQISRQDTPSLAIAKNALDGAEGSSS